MGIRINKRMGFLYVADQALDLEMLEGLTLESLKSAAADKKDELKLSIDFYDAKLSLPLAELITDIPPLDGDQSEKYYYLFTPPPYLQTWSRYNDSIDYYESESVAERKVQYLNSKIFPYCEKMIVASTYQEVGEKLEVWCGADNLRELTAVSEDFLKEFSAIGLDTSKSLAGQIYMQAPLVLQLTAKCLGLNSLALRPVIVTYWS